VNIRGQYRRGSTLVGALETVPALFVLKKTDPGVSRRLKKHQFPGEPVAHCLNT